MVRKASKSEAFLNKAVVRVIDELRELHKKQPRSRSVRLALDGMLTAFIDEARADEEVEGSEVVERLRRVAKVFPDSPVPYANLSNLYLGRKEYEEARRTAEEGLRIVPGDYHLVFNHSLALEEMGDYEGAIVGFKHCLDLNPKYAWTYTNLGEAYRMLKLYDQAEKHLRAALEIDEHFVPALGNMAMLYNDWENWPACVHFGQLALRYGPPNKETHLCMGDALLHLKDYETGLQHLVAATLIDPDFVEAYESMSDAYAELGMYELCVGAAQEALKRDPTSWMALANIGYGYGKQGRFEEAIKVYHEVLERVTDPDERYRQLWELGWDCFMADQYDMALDYTDQAIDLKEHPDLILFFNKGLILLAQGKTEEANAVYAQAMQRAEVLDSQEVLVEARNDLVSFLGEGGVEIDPDSAMFKLLDG